MSRYPVNDIGIDSLQRTNHGTRFRIGFTVDDGHGKDDQVGSHVLVDVPNSEADLLLRPVLEALQERVDLAIETHLNDPVWK